MKQKKKFKKQKIRTRSFIVTEQQLKDINMKINSLIRENEKLLIIGDKAKYQNNCNVLKGISFVMGKIGR